MKLIGVVIQFLLPKFITPEEATRRFFARKCSSNAKSKNQFIQNFARSLSNNFLKKLSVNKAAGLKLIAEPK